MVQGLSNTAYGTRRGVSEGAVRKWSKSGFVVRYADGSIDPEATDRKLKGSLDPARTSDRTKGKGTRQVRTDEDGTSPKQIALAGPLECLDNFEEPAHRGAGFMALHLLRVIPASASSFAIDAGASVRTAIVLRRLMIAVLVFSIDDLLTGLGVDGDLLQINPDCIDDLDWRRAAEDAGEPYEPEAWEAWAAERIALINGASAQGEPHDRN